MDKKVETFEEALHHEHRVGRDEHANGDYGSDCAACNDLRAAHARAIAEKEAETCDCMFWV